MTETDAQTASLGASDPTRNYLRRSPWITAVWPAATLIVIVVSLMRTGVDLADVLRFAIYWLIAVLMPGLAVSRLLVGCRRTLFEDLAVGAATGVSLEVIVGYVGGNLGLAGVRFWWLPVLAVSLLVGPWRRQVLTRVPDRLPGWHAALVSLAVVFIVIGVDVRWFRSTPLPPQAGEVYFDNWWQLSLVQELMRFERPEVPQISGEPLSYHYLANLHVATASKLTGVLPEVLLFRLWLLPVIAVTVGLAVVLGRLLTSSVSAGVATAWLAYVIPVGTYIWPTLSPNVPASLTPIQFHSPSQILANVGIMAAAVGVVSMLRGDRTRGAVTWLTVVAVAASGMKSTVVPILAAGCVLALARAAWIRSPLVRPLAVLLSGLCALQVVVLALAAGTSGGDIIPLGSLRMLRMYRQAVGDSTLHGTNAGFVLDSLSSWRAVAIGALGLAVIVGVQAVRVVGVFALLHPRSRRDLTVWWLAGAVLAGYGMLLALDHIGTSQVWFAYGSGQLGVALTVYALWLSASDHAVSSRRIIMRGLAGGAALTLVVAYFSGVRRRAGGYGLVDEAAFPLLIALIVGMIGLLVARRPIRCDPSIRVQVWPMLLAGVIGALLPLATVDTGRTVYRWLQPVEYRTGASPSDALSVAELEAMIWLRANSEGSDVIATNLHCRPAPNEPFCDARGFWVVGLSGRRAVLEGWAYTDEAQGLQGVQGRPYARQPAPQVERAVLNRATFEESDPRALARLAGDYGVRWLVAVHRAGAVPTFPEGLVEIAFENDAVTIMQVS